MLHRSCNLLWSDFGQIVRFFKILTQQAIGVLVGATLPAVIGMRKVNLQTQTLFQFPEVSEFCAVVQCHGLQVFRR